MTRRKLAVLVAIGTLYALVPEQVEADLTASRRTAVVEAVERVQPAVVSVHVTYRQRFVQRYYRRDPFFDLLYPFVEPVERDRISTGSGVIVSDEGHVLTNGHVVGDPDRLQQISVSLADGRTFKATHLASDISFDLAVLKIDGERLPVAP